MSKYKMAIVMFLLIIRMTEAMEEGDNDSSNLYINKAHLAPPEPSLVKMAAPSYHLEGLRNIEDISCSLFEIELMPCELYKIFQHINLKTQKFFLLNIFKILCEEYIDTAYLTYSNFFDSKTLKDLFLKSIAIRFKGTFIPGLKIFINENFLNYFNKDSGFTLFFPKDSMLQINLDKIVNKAIKLIEVRSEIINSIIHTIIDLKKEPTTHPLSQLQQKEIQAIITFFKDKLYEDLRDNLPEWMSTYIFNSELLSLCLREQISHQQAFIDSKLEILKEELFRAHKDHETSEILKEELFEECNKALKTLQEKLFKMSDDLDRTKDDLYEANSALQLKTKVLDFYINREREELEKTKNKTNPTYSDGEGWEPMAVLLDNIYYSVRYDHKQTIFSSHQSEKNSSENYTPK